MGPSQSKDSKGKTLGRKDKNKLDHASHDGNETGGPHHFTIPWDMRGEPEIEDQENPKQTSGIMKKIFYYLYFFLFSLYLYIFIITKFGCL